MCLPSGDHLGSWSLSQEKVICRALAPPVSAIQRRETYRPSSKSGSWTSKTTRLPSGLTFGLWGVFSSTKARGVSLCFNRLTSVFRHSGIQAFRHSGVQAFRYSVDYQLTFDLRA